MGWTASASEIKKDFWGKDDDLFEAITAKHPAGDDFRQAMLALQARGVSCDFTFDIGLLCVRATGRALFAALGRPMQHSGVLYPDEVKELALEANWDAVSEETDDSKEVAKAFLSLCAKHGLGVDLG